MKALIVVDMQKDFVDGSLANKEAQAIIPAMCEYIKEFNGMLYATLDTHNTDYLETQEGENLPIEHCLAGTPGNAIDERVYQALKDNPYYHPIFVPKFTFGTMYWANEFENKFYDDERSEILEEIQLIGTCTDICVITNALILKTLYPEAKIVVLKDLCAGVTPEKHEAALEVMRSCQIEVI